MGTPTIPIKVPVLVPCIEPSAIPTIPATAMPPKTAGIEAMANGAAVDALTYRNLAQQQNDLLRSCAQPRS
jgi:hypothetical protein